MTCNEFNGFADSYLLGNIPEEKREEFEFHYFQCNKCYAAVKLSERLYSRDVPIIIAQREFSLFRYWKPALAFATLLIGVLSFFVFRQHSGNDQWNYNITAFTPPVYIETETRDGFLRENAFSQAMKHYNKKEYTQALIILNHIPAENDIPAVPFFKGICLLILDRKTEAIYEFDRIIKQMNPSYYDEALYFKAISLVRSNRLGEAQIILNNLQKMFSPLSPNAKQLVEKISTSH